MNIIEKNLKDIKPYEKNPRKNDNAVEYVANSIKEFGFKVPIVIDKDGVIVAGHTRYKASKKLGLEKVPCIIADDLTPEQIKAYRLADNKVAEGATWDDELLKGELNFLFGKVDMNTFGFPVQIEDIDLAGLEDLGEVQEEIANELGERNDYVVLEIKSELDWERAQTLLGLKKVATGDKNPKVRRHGIGRVIDAKDVLDKLEKYGGESE